MKVLLCGYHNPHFINSVVYREKALSSLGHEVIFFEETKYVLPGRIRQMAPSLDHWDICRLNQSLVNVAKRTKPDVCLIVGGNRILAGTISQISNMGIPTGLWTTDVPIDFKIILASAPFYTHLFCAGTEAMDIFHGHGLKNTTWVPFGCDPNFHKRIALDRQTQKELGKDIIFVGSYYPNRAKVLEAISDFDLGVWGPYWEKLSEGSPLRSKAVNIKMNVGQWVKIFNAAKINMVIHYQDGTTPSHQASPKIFEALACGCFVMTDRQKDALSLFKDKEHLVFFDDVKDLRAKIGYYLGAGDERNRIAQAGFTEVITRHMYEHRMKQIVDILGRH